MRTDHAEDQDPWRLLGPNDRDNDDEDEERGVVFD